MIKNLTVVGRVLRRLAVLLIACLGLTVPAAAEPHNLPTILFFDLESPFEVDTWIKELGLQRQGCSVGIDYCNDWLKAVRPTLNGDHFDSNDLLEWLEEHQVVPDAVFVTGHHAGGFFGEKGSLSILDLKEALSAKDCNRVFCNPRFVYLGGCYTTESLFRSTEVSPAAYLNRVLTHAEQASGVNLLIGAIHQIANSNDPSPWTSVFPNATILGYGAVGPGDNSHAGTSILISKFLLQLNAMFKTQNSAQALGQLLKRSQGQETDRETSIALARWWGSRGRQISQTSASASAVKLPKTIQQLQTNRFETVIDVEINDTLSRLAIALAEMDIKKYSWLKNVTPFQRLTMLRDTLVSLNRRLIEVDETLKNTLASLNKSIQSFLLEPGDMTPKIELILDIPNIWRFDTRLIKQRLVSFYLNTNTSRQIRKRIPEALQVVGISSPDQLIAITKYIKEEVNKSNSANINEQEAANMIGSFRSSGDLNVDLSVVGMLYQIGDLIAANERSLFMDLIPAVASCIEKLEPLEIRDERRLARWVKVKSASARDSIAKYFIKYPTKDMLILRGLARTLLKEFQIVVNYENETSYYASVVEALNSNAILDGITQYYVATAVTENAEFRNPKFTNSALSLLEGQAVTHFAAQSATCTIYVLAKIEPSTKSRVLRLMSNMTFKYQGIRDYCMGVYKDDPALVRDYSLFLKKLPTDIVDW